MKNIFTVLLVSFILTSCASTATPESPNTITTSSITLTVPYHTNTPLPTSTKLPPTVTEAPHPTLEFKEYGDTLAEVSGQVNFDTFNNANIEVANGLYLRRWVPFTLDNGETIALAVWVENPSKECLFMILSSTGSALPLNYQPTDAEIDDLLIRTRTGGGWSGETRITLLTGNMSDEILQFDNPFTGILENDLANRMIDFSYSLNSDFLPRYNNVPYPLLFSYGISLPANPVVTPVNP